MILRQQSSGAAGAHAKAPEAGSAESLLEDLLAERLSRSGWVVKTSASAVDSVAEVTASGGGPHLEYRILELKVDYPSGWRRHYVGRREIERVVRANLHLRLMEDGEGAVLWAGTAERASRDVVPFDLLSSLESQSFGFTKAQAQDQKWDRILEPVIATAIVGGLIYLFYSNKSTS